MLFIVFFIFFPCLANLVFPCIIYLLLSLLYLLGTMEGDQENNTITGYIHNVFPVKKSSDVPYFDMQIKTKDNVIRGVCFYQNFEERDEFSSVSKKRSPVETINFRLDDSQDLTSVLMQSNTMLENIEQLDFNPLNPEPAQYIGALSAVK